MTDQALVPTVDGAIMEKVFLHGDLKELSPSQRVTLYLKKCESLRLNPLSEPFQYIVLNGKLTLYAKKDCTEQLRKRDGVSVTSVTPQQIGETYVVTVTVRDREGRVDAATGAVCITGLKGEALSNAMMKAETKGKRRATLSLCGLGITDESEIESIPGAQVVNVNTQTGEIAMPPAPTQELPTEPPTTTTNAGLRVVSAELKEGTTNEKAWKLWILKFSDGREAVTFDQKVAELAQACLTEGADVDLTVEPHPKKKGSWKVVELKKVTPVEHELF